MLDYLYSEEQSSYKEQFSVESTVRECSSTVDHIIAELVNFKSIYQTFAVFTDKVIIRY